MDYISVTCPECGKNTEYDRELQEWVDTQNRSNSIEYQEASRRVKDDEVNPDNLWAGISCPFFCQHSFRMTWEGEAKEHLSW